MSKINPLQRIIGLPEDQAGVKKRPNGTSSTDKPFTLDKVEISAQALEAQRMENLEKVTMSSELTEEARVVGGYWYQIGYHLLDLTK